MVHLLLFLMMVGSLGAQQGVRVIPAANGRQTVRSQVGSLVCTLDNIGGAAVTIHIICRVPAGYILIATTTPRYKVGTLIPGATPPYTIDGFSRGGFTDELGNTIRWRVWQEYKGTVSYWITDTQSPDGTGQAAGWMGPRPLLSIAP